MRCATHFALVARERPEGLDDQVAAGRALQRFWLTATRLGLQLQPEMTPLIFSRYVREDVRFCRSGAAYRRALRVAERLEDLLGEQAAPRAVFMGRLGKGAPARSRSLRRPLASLLR